MKLDLNPDMPKFLNMSFRPLHPAALLACTLFLITAASQGAQLWDVRADSSVGDSPDDDSTTLSDEWEGPQNLWIGFGAGTGIVSRHRLLGLQEISASLGGFINDSHALQFNASYLHTPLSSTSDPEYPIAHGLSLLELQADLRMYTPARYSFLHHYFSFGAGIAAAIWSYDARTSFIGSGEHADDYLLGYDIHLGMGFVLGEFWPLSLNLEMTPGILLWSSGKDEEYARASLPVLPYFKMRLQCTIPTLSL